MFTPLQDAVLREGIAKHRKDGRAKVADFVGEGVKGHLNEVAGAVSWKVLHMRE